MKIIFIYSIIYGRSQNSYQAVQEISRKYCFIVHPCYHRGNNIMKQCKIFYMFDFLQVKRDLISSRVNFILELTAESPKTQSSLLDCALKQFITRSSLLDCLRKQFITRPSRLDCLRSFDRSFIFEKQ